MNARDSQLESPKLDERSFQDLVDDARRGIQQRCPTWTDHNVSDPGVMLVELYAHMTDMLLYRLNLTPNRSYLSFLKLIGAEPQPAKPAAGEVIFSLSLDATLAAGETIRIPAGTETGTTPDVDSERVFFATDIDDAIEAARPVAFLTRGARSDWDGGKSNDFLGGKTVVIWSSDGAVSRFAIGFQNNLSRHQIEVSLTTTQPPDSTAKTAPTLSWQYFRKSDQAVGQDSAWKDLSAQPDDSSAPTPGRFLLQLPGDCGQSTLQGTMAGTWIQGVAQPVAGNTDPWVATVEVRTRGLSVPVTEGRMITDEDILGTSDQQPGQSFEIRTKPVMPPDDRDQFVEVEQTPGSGDWEFWKVVDDFADSKDDDKHCMLDLREGKVLFGPRFGVKQFGAIPKSGVRIRVRRYRVGGGEKGNLPEGTELSLLTTIPKLSPRVKMPTLRTRGQDAEPLDAAKLLAPGRVRDAYRQRAVTRDDFEELVNKMPNVGKAYCVQQGDLGAPPAAKSDKPELVPGDEQTRTQFEAGKVKLLVTPVHPDLDLIKNKEYTEEFINRRKKPHSDTELVLELGRTELAWPPDLADDIGKQLDSFRLLTATVDIKPPIYVLLSVQITISTRAPSDPESVRQELEMALYKYFHPLHGGGGKGWAFNERRVAIDQVYNVASQVRGVDQVTFPGLGFYEKSGADGNETWKLTDLRTGFLELPRRCVLYSGRHAVTLA